MEHSEFELGMIFWCGGGQWRCTDIGTRTIIAIRIDRITIETLTAETNALSSRVLDFAAAQAEGWFNGPPYAVVETVFDEYDLEGCSLEQKVQA